MSLSFLLLGFGVVVALSLLFGTLAALPLSRTGHWVLVWRRQQCNARRLRRRGQTPVGDVPLLIGSPRSQRWRQGIMAYWWGGLVLLGLFVFIFVHVEAMMRAYLIAMLGAGFLLSLCVFGTQVDVRPVPRDPTRAPLPFNDFMDRLPPPVSSVIVVAFFTLVMVGLCVRPIQDLSMLVMGYRQHDVSVRLGKEDFLTLADYATRAGYALNACQPLDPAMPIIEHIDIISHALGATALLRYPALPLMPTEAAVRAAIRFEPPNASIMVVSSAAGDDICREFLLHTLFRPGQTGLRRDVTPRIDAQLDGVRLDPARSIMRLAIIDSVEPVLAAGRAQVLKALLLARYQVAPSAIVVEVGRTDRKRACAELDLGTLCGRANRRVEIRVEPLP